MSIDEYLIGSPHWIWPAVIAALIVGLAALGNYLVSGLTGWRFLALVLKLVGIAIIAVCLIEPLGRGTRPRPQANMLPILVDTSQSMQVRNAERKDSDADRISELLSDEPKWLTKAAQMFDVRRYQFDSRLQQIDDFSALEFTGTGSNLRSALETLGSRYSQRPVAGCLLFTDGNLTDATPLETWQQLGFPIYPVRDADASQLRDLGIENIAVSETNFETAPVTINANVVAKQLDGRSVLVRLRDEAGELIEQQTLELQADLPAQPVQFRFRPISAGVSFYALECVLADEPNAIEAGTSSVEATVLNNRKLVTVNQDRGPFPVLYLSGRPNWEFKFIRRAIDEDAEIRLVALLRIAKSQPKFSFRDADVRSSANPLFAGLGGTEEEAAEQLDEAVIIRLGVEDAGELAGGFPKDAETLFPYSAVILDDVEASFFTQDQLLLLRQFVSNRGGALLMLGGEDALEKGVYTDTPLGELAPVYFPSRFAQQSNNQESPAAPFSLKLTREGLLQPFLRLRGTEQAEAERLLAAPPLRVLNRVGRIKPGAAVLAVAEDQAGRSAPALVTQPFGRGRTAALMVGDLWRWSLQRDGESAAATDFAVANQTNESSNRDDPPQVWRQLVRWLVSDVARRLEARVEPGDMPDTVRLLVAARDVDFTPLDGANIRVVIETPVEGEAVELELEPIVQERGVYSVDFWPKTPGGYRAKFTATGPDGGELGTLETGWASDPAEREFANLGTNLATLEELAQSTGGQVIPLSEVDQFTEELINTPVPVREFWEFPIWHRWWVCGLALLCLCSEWGIRRWKGLP
ncbi:hypothetical protein SH139x_004019 [Planctomycetaceae bacterium SH139]